MTDVLFGRRRGEGGHPFVMVMCMRLVRFVLLLVIATLMVSRV
jgi:hypothetical protein